MKEPEKRKSAQIIVRMNEQLKSDLRQYASQTGKEISEMVRDSIKERIYKKE